MRFGARLRLLAEQARQAEALAAEKRRKAAEEIDSGR
jgi:hypothetical protein